MHQQEIRRWVATVAFTLPLALVGCSDGGGASEERYLGDETQVQEEDAAERAPGAGAGGPTTAGPEHASEVELDDDPDDDLPAPAGIGGGETHGHRDYGGARGANTSPYDVPGANPSDIYD